MQCIPSLAAGTQALSTSTIAFPAASQGKKVRKRGMECTTNPCRRPSALRCPRAKCLSHCLEEGGCPIHQVPILEDSERRDDGAEPLDPEGLGFYDLHNALSASLIAQGLEVPAHVASLHDILQATATTTTPPLAPPPLLNAAPSLSRKQPRVTSQLDPRCSSFLSTDPC